MKTVLLLIAFVFASIHIADAQQTKKVPRIGYLATKALFTESFLEALRDLGYFEGENIAFEFRTTDGKAERYPDLIAELVRLKVDVIEVGGNSATRAAKQATSTIPIVMTSVGDPIALGLVSSLPHPGGNITGLTQMSPDLTGKRLELLKDLLPKVRRVALIWDPTNPGMALRFKEAQAAAQTLGITLHSVEVRNDNELANAFASVNKEHAGALVVPAPITGRYEKQIGDLRGRSDCHGSVTH